MTQFTYTAIPLQGATGARITGTRKAPDERSLRDELRESGLIVLEARPVHVLDALRAGLQSRTSGRPRHREGAWFFQTLRTLLDGKVPIESALKTMIELAPNPRIKAACTEVREQLRTGASLAQAVEHVGGLASDRHIMLLRTGHESGRLDHIIRLIDDSISSAAALRRTLVGRLIYPAMLLVVAMLAVWGLSTFVIPKFAAQLEAMGGTLPLPTRMTLAAADIGVWLIPLLMVLIAVSIIVRKHWFTPKLRARLSRLALRLPIVGSLIQHAQAAVICDLLATMLEGGGGLLDGLNQAREAVTSPEIVSRLDDARAQVREGSDLGVALCDHHILPPLVGAMVRVGVESGDLVPALRRAARACTDQQEYVSQRLMTLMEPAVIVMLAGAVFWVVYSLVSGMLAMNDLQGL